MSDGVLRRFRLSRRLNPRVEFLCLKGQKIRHKCRPDFLSHGIRVARKEHWRVQDAGSLGGGGTLTTAGNLVFHGPVAYNTETGEKRWEVNLGGNPVTPITYMLGKHYISLFVRPQTNSRLFPFVVDGR
jgi:hypothetical protein